MSKGTNPNVNASSAIPSASFTWAPPRCKQQKASFFSSWRSTAHPVRRPTQEPQYRLLEQWPGRAHEPDNQGRYRQTLPLRQPRSASQPPQRLYGSRQLCTPARDAKRANAIRVHPKNLDIRARSIHPKSDPPDAETERLARCCSPGPWRCVRPFSPEHSSSLRLNFGARKTSFFKTTRTRPVARASLSRQIEVVETPGRLPRRCPMRRERGT